MLVDFIMKCMGKVFSSSRLSLIYKNERKFIVKDSFLQDNKRKKSINCFLSQLLCIRFKLFVSFLLSQLYTDKSNIVSVEKVIHTISAMCITFSIFHNISMAGLCPSTSSNTIRTFPSQLRYHIIFNIKGYEKGKWNYWVYTRWRFRDSSFSMLSELCFYAIWNIENNALSYYQKYCLAFRKIYNFIFLAKWTT